MHPALASRLVPIDRLVVAEDHVRAIDAAAAVLDRFGQRVPVVARAGGLVISGAEWVLGARQLGWTEVAVVYVDDDAGTALAYSIAAYRIADRSAFNDVLLLQALDALEDDPELRDATGCDAGFHNDLRARLTPKPLEALVDVLAPPELDLAWAPLPLVPVRWPTTLKSTPARHAVAFKTLISYHYYQTMDVAVLQQELGGAQIFADCGAYTAKTQGAEIAMADYVAWLGRWASNLEAFVNLDVIGDGHETAVNQAAIEGMGVDALPVFHGGEDWRYLEAYCEQYPYVCLGGMVGFADTASLMTWLAKSFDVAARYGTVLHGFGQTRPDVLAAFPWYSADSSSWGSAYRFGNIQLWDHRAGCFVTVAVGDHAGVYAQAELIREHGVDPEVLANRDAYHNRFACQASAAAWYRYAAFLHRRHGDVCVRDGSRAPGLHLYLVDGSTQHLKTAAAHLRMLAGLDPVDVTPVPAVTPGPIVDVPRPPPLPEAERPWTARRFAGEFNGTIVEELPLEVS